jgi:DNA polymerase-3 subunit beta
MVATDGHRLAVADLSSRVAQWEGEALIPRKAAAEILRMLHGGEVTLHLTPSHTLVQFDEAQLNARLIEGQFPNYQQVIPTSTTKHVNVTREALSGALRRTSAILGERAAPTTLDLKGGQAVVGCVNAEVGEARERVAVEYAGEGISVGFNARYLLDFLSVVEEEEIEIHLNDALSPILFRPKGNESYKCVIMPMRI